MRRLIISIVLTLLLTVWAHRLYLTEAGFDGKLFIIIITLAYMVCYKLVQYLARFKIIENNSRIDIVFVVCVIAFMFVPSCILTATRFRCRKTGRWPSMFL